MQARFYHPKIEWLKAEMMRYVDDSEFEIIKQRFDADPKGRRGRS